jgi:putative ABC transport system ATP-binding protein
MSFIVIDHVSKDYAGGEGAARTPVLHDLNERLGEGEFVCVMGPSGSGKSTLLTIVGAMNHPTEGRLVIDGIDVYALRDEPRADFRREYLGFVFQQHHLLSHLSALENVMLPLTTIRMPSREKQKRAAHAIGRVGLDGKGHRLPGQLSGGEQGRVAIARALVNEPPLLLADEPTGALDSQTGGEVMDVFRSLSAGGQTLFMVTHNAENAALAHRVIHMRDGRIESTTQSADRSVAKTRTPERSTESLRPNGAHLPHSHLRGDLHV